MSKAIWGARPCPRCGASPGAYCTSPSGLRASLPHRERYPEGPPRTKTPEQRERIRKSEPPPEPERRSYRHLPPDDAAKAIVRDRMRAFRERRVAVG